MHFYVYVLFYLNGTPCYIGKGKGDRWLNHEQKKRFRNNYLKGIIIDAKQRGLSLPKIKIREHITETEAFETERILIKIIGRRNLGTGPLVNLTDGGDGETGRVVSQETRAKLRDINLGKTLSEEHKANISRGLKASGFIFSEEQRQSISKNQRGKSKVWTPEGRTRFIKFHTGKQWRLGHKHTEESKKLIREARAKQAPFSEETRAKLSLIQTGRRHSATSKEKMRTSWVTRKERMMRNVKDEVR